MDAKEKRLTERVIGCAIAVSNELGAGFLEAVYGHALAIELARAGIAYEAQKALEVRYKGRPVGHYQADFTVEGCLLLELKALSALTREHDAQVMNYLRASGITVGLLLNFGRPKLEFRRIVLQYNDTVPI